MNSKKKLSLIYLAIKISPVFILFTTNVLGQEPATLLADPGDGTTFGYTLEVELSTNADRIYYTRDGSVPDTNNSDQLYTEVITIPPDSPDTVTIKAIAVGEEYSPTSKSYTYYREYLPKITAIPNGMEFLESINISFFIDHLKAKIYYTIDGSEPDTNSSSTILYTGSPIELTETTTLKAKAFAPDVMPSPLLLEIYTRVFIVKEGVYRDSDGDGRIDMVDIFFDELPYSLPTAVVLTNPFDNSQKDTVYSDGISWLNDDPSTLTINIMLNKPFPESENTEFEADYYGNVIEDPYMNYDFEIDDGVAPVINSATYCPGEIIDIETFEHAFDTLVVYFSEDVENINSNQPFLLKTEEGTEYSFNLRQISNVYNMVVFEIIKDEEEEVDYPFNEDSIKINYEAGVSDLRDNIQNIENNRYAYLLFKTIPYKLIITTISPVNPFEYQIPDSLIAEGININKGLIIVADFMENLRHDTQKLKSEIDIFDPGNNLVAQCKSIDDKSGNLQIGIVNDYSTKIVFYWNGKDQNGANVCGGTYIAKLYIVDHKGRYEIYTMEIDVISDNICESRSCGDCGTSAVLAFLPAIWLRASSFYRKRVKKKKTFRKSKI